MIFVNGNSINKLNNSINATKTERNRITQKDFFNEELKFRYSFIIKLIILIKCYINNHYCNFNKFKAKLFFSDSNLCAIFLNSIILILLISDIDTLKILE